MNCISFNELLSLRDDYSGEKTGDVATVSLAGWNNRKEALWPVSQHQGGMKAGVTTVIPRGLWTDGTGFPTAVES